VPVETSPDLDEIRVSGEIDLSNVLELEDALLRALARHTHVTVHVEEVTYIGLEGARALLRAAQALPQRGRLYVTRPSAQLVRVLEILDAGRVPALVLLPNC
jgi:anti-anti-sigma factor